LKHEPFFACSCYSLIYQPSSFPCQLESEARELSGQQLLHQPCSHSNSPLTTMALAAYRHLLRSARIAFQGDLPLLTAARHEARAGFLKNASLSPEDPALAPAIAHAEDVANILRQNVVQGKHEGDDMYKLRIHEHTERGDNDTIKMPNGQKVVIDGKTCADR